MTLRARSEVDLHSSNADASLASAVDAARLHGFPFAIAEELIPLAPRLRAILHSEPLDDFANAVLGLLDRVVPLAEPSTQVALVDPLTSRELVVLRYLESRLTTSEIGNELYVSVNTVRTHVKAVYRKLGVGSRRGRGCRGTPSGDPLTERAPRQQFTPTGVPSRAASVPRE